MTHLIYSQQQLHHKSIARLKQIYSEIGASVEVADKRCKECWITAIANYQATQSQKATCEQAQPTANVPLTPIEISFYDHEYYAGDKLIAAITYDNDLTQPWVVMVNNKEVHRASTVMLCHRYICSHYKDGSLPVQEQDATEMNGTTENQIMAHIFNECQNYGFEMLDDGIYHNDVKLGEVGCTDGNWWVIQGSSGQQQYSNSVFDAMCSLCPSQTSLSMVEVLNDAEVTDCEQLQYGPLEQLNSVELQELLDAEVTHCEQLLNLPFEQLTTQDWLRLREYEPVAA